MHVVHYLMSTHTCPVQITFVPRLLLALGMRLGANANISIKKHTHTHTHTKAAMNLLLPTAHDALCSELCRQVHTTLNLCTYVHAFVDTCTYVCRCTQCVYSMCTVTYTYIHVRTYLFFLEEFTHFTHVCVSKPMNWAPMNVMTILGMGQQ